jgi:hypothetical protein
LPSRLVSLSVRVPILTVVDNRGVPSAWSVSWIRWIVERIVSRSPSTFVPYAWS